MRNPKLFLIALTTLTLSAGCAKETASTTATATVPTSAERQAEVTPPPQPTEAVPAETATAAGEPVTATTPQSAPQSPAAPAPMLPRRGETAPVAQAAQPQPNNPAASQRISIPDAYEVIRAGNGVLLDVRTADAHQYQRIPGSLHIPLNEVAARASELPQDKWIITYCTCPAEESSGAAATTLKNMGFERVAALLGGMQGWRGQGLPVEFGK